MDDLPWFLYVLLGMNFLILAAVGLSGLILVFWFVKLLQAAVRALERWQSARPAPWECSS
jgi:hypothetical protein